MISALRCSGTITARVALMALTGAAVLAFFNRHWVDTRVWNTRVAPALGLIDIVGMTALVLANSRR